MAWGFEREETSLNSGHYLTPPIDGIEGEFERYETLGKAFATRLRDAWREKVLAAGVQHLAEPDYPEFSPFPLPPMMHGWRWPMPDRPFLARLKKPKKTIVDIIETPFECYAVSEKVIDLIERIEPGVHQYLPFELVYPDGAFHHEKRWLLNVCTRVDVFDAECSNVASLKPREVTVGDKTVIVYNGTFYDGPSDRYLVGKKVSNSRPRPLV